MLVQVVPSSYTVRSSRSENSQEKSNYPPHSFVLNSPHKQAAMSVQWKWLQFLRSFPIRKMIAWADYQGQVQNSDAQATITDGTIPLEARLGLNTHKSQGLKTYGTWQQTVRQNRNLSTQSFLNQHVTISWTKQWYNSLIQWISNAIHFLHGWENVHTIYKFGFMLRNDRIAIGKYTIVNTYVPLLSRTVSHFSLRRR